MATKLFDDHEPKCEYCVHLAAQQGRPWCLRKKTGELRVCRSFEYDPLKRVPRQEARLPEYRPEDFAGFESGAGDK